MNAIYILVPIALVFVAIAVWVFLWAVKDDQFDDLEGPAHKILFDDDVSSPKAPPKKEEQNVPNNDKTDNK